MRPSAYQIDICGQAESGESIKMISLTLYRKEHSTHPSFAYFYVLFYLHFYENYVKKIIQLIYCYSYPGIT